MIKKTITFEDFDGNKRTEDFYFNLSRAEIVELEVSEKDGYFEMLREVGNGNDGKEIIKRVKQLIGLSYGVRSDDNRRFIKSKQLTEDFLQTAAYDTLFIELCTNGDACGEFFAGVIPKGQLLPNSNDPSQKTLASIQEIELPTEDIVTTTPETDADMQAFLAWKDQQGRGPLTD